MSEYLDEAVWREQYRDLVGGVRVIREAIEEALGPLAPASEYSSHAIQECDNLAVAVASYAEKTRRRIAELEKQCEALKEQVALTSRITVDEIMEEAPPLASA
jgi:hypothetical protein